MILVIGPSFIDEYVYVKTRGVDQAQPALKMLRANHMQAMPGGAAYVARCLQALGCEVTLATMTGSMFQHRFGRVEMKGVDMITQAGPTYVKRRFIDESTGHTVLRIDESTLPKNGGIDPWANKSWVQSIYELFAKSYSGISGVVISDYGGGFFTNMPTKLWRILGSADDDKRPYGAFPTIVDPYPDESSPADYRYAAYVTPNSAQLLRGANLRSRRDAAHDWASQLGEKTRIIETCGKDGAKVYVGGAKTLEVPGIAVSSVDTTGAGDAFVAGLMYGLRPRRFMRTDALQLSHLETANLVAALSTTKIGTQPVYLYELIAHKAKEDTRCKVVGDGSCVIQSAKAVGRKIVVTNGVFDLFHEGHYNLLTKAKRDPNEYLVVLVNNDDSVARIKESRPFDPVGWRTKMVASVPTVDLVMEFSQDTPVNDMFRIKPDVLIKGDEYDGTDVIGLSAAGELRLVPMASGSSKWLFNTTAKAAFIAERVKGVTSGETKEADAKTGVSPSEAVSRPKGKGRVSSRPKGGSPRRTGVPKRKARGK